MKKTLLMLSVLAVGVSVAQQRPATPPTTAPQTNATAPAAPAMPQKPKPKTFKDVVTDKAITRKGLFTVHKVEEKYYFEIPDSIINREIMAITRIAKTPSGAGYGGEIANRQTLSFEKGPNENIFLRCITLVSYADSTDNIAKAVTNSNVNTIAASFPIVCLGKDSTSTLIDVTDFFKGDNQVVSINPNLKRRYSLTVLAADRSYIQKITSYPINTEVRTVKTFNAAPAGGFGGPQMGGGASLPAASNAGAVTMEVNTSFILLPKTPMAVRYWDKRVGYFPDDYVKYSDNQQRVENKMFAVRWRLEPKEGEEEKWKKGELVEPKKPIIYYVDPATPKQWRKHLIAGVNDWQKAFEKAGFKNAIMGKEWPENDSTMSLEDARFSVIRYFASDIENAYGPNVHDPRSGEILESHIGWYHNVMKLVHDWYMIQTAAVDPRARKMKFDDDLMGDLIRFVSSHEVGHTLGLLHNMGSSSRTPVEKLRDKAFVEANGHTASIMDYARFNYVAQPEDNISKAGLYPRIGDYDEWAIRWGYGYIPGTTEEEQKLNSNKLIKETLAKNPRTWFGTYELGNSADPRSQSEDLSDDAVKASEYGIKNLKRIIKNLAEWTKEEGDLNTNVAEMYVQLLGQYRRYAGHVARNVGGVYETFKSAEENDAVYEVTPKNKQKEALNYLQKQVFETPTWLIDKELWNKFNNPISNNPVMNAQEGALANLLSVERLNRMQLSVDRFGEAKSYGALEMLNDLQTGLFSELKTNKAIDPYRRLLQRGYTDRLVALISNEGFAVQVLTIGLGGASVNSTDTKKTDLPSIARAQLVKLRGAVNAASVTATDTMSKIHLQDLAEKIKRALDPK